jgi:hypothetical protein
MTLGIFKAIKAMNLMMESISKRTNIRNKDLAGF